MLKDGKYLQIIICLSGLLFYSLGFFIFFPRTFVSYDASIYVTQAMTYLRGYTYVPLNDILHNSRKILPGTYPVGTPLLQMPFIYLLGIRYAVLASFFSLLFSMLILIKLLIDEGRSPLFSFLLLGYPPTLVFARCETSDLPSCLMVTLSLWLFWRGQSQPRYYWFGSGLIAGLSLLFRETNILFFIPLFLGTLLRRENHKWDLIAGCILGSSFRLLTAFIVYGNPFFIKDSCFSFSLNYVLINAPIYLFSLLVMVPAGLIIVCLYKGRRSPEIIITIFIVLFFFLTYGYSAQNSGGIKRLVNAPRFFIPLIPFIIIAYSEVITIKCYNIVKYNNSHINYFIINKISQFIIILWMIIIYGNCFIVHPYLYYWSASNLKIREALLKYTKPNGIVIANTLEINKYMNIFYDYRKVIIFNEMSPEDILRVIHINKLIYIVSLNRYDCILRKEAAEASDQFIKKLNIYCLLIKVFAMQYSNDCHLKIWQVRECNRLLPKR